MKIRKIISLLMLWSTLMMTYTGCILFIAPHGRVAYWSNWHLLGLNKNEYGDLHIIFSLLFMIAALIHIYYNWKAIISYLKNRTKQLIVLTNNMLIALIISILFFTGTYFHLPPFSTFLNMGETVKNTWSKSLGEPPFGHAEQATLKKLTKFLNLDLEMTIMILKKHGLKEISSTSTILEIANKNHLTPNELFKILKSEMHIKIKKRQKKKLKQ